MRDSQLSLVGIETKIFISDLAIMFICNKTSMIIELRILVLSLKEISRLV